jgi:hypothetical protein
MFVPDKKKTNKIPASFIVFIVGASVGVQHIYVSKFVRLSKSIKFHNSWKTVEMFSQLESNCNEMFFYLYQPGSLH